ncbi:MAG TPA: MFS transporter, partial [Gemmataceae bacterium]|nr:MFS transporter [Gemmataceae bacterium]
MSDPLIQTTPSAGVPADPSIPDASSLSNLAADSGPPQSDPAARKALFIAFLVVAIDLLGFGIVLPLLPRYGEVYVGAWLGIADKEALKHDVRVGLVLGALFTIFSLMQFVFAPMWGRLSDRYGRRPFLLMGLAGSVAFYTLFGYASDLPHTAEWAGLALLLLFLSRLGAGVAGATISTAQAVIADCTTAEKRKHGMALIGMAFGVGFTFGPLVAVGSLYWSPGREGVVGYCAAGLSLIALILAVALLPETRRFGAGPTMRRKLFDWQATRYVLSNPAVGPVVWAFFITTLGFGMFETTLSLLAQDALQIEDKNNGLLFAYVGLVLALTQGGLYRRLAKRVSEPTFMAAGMVLMGLGVASMAGVNALANAQLLGFGGLLTLLMIALTIAVVGFSLLTPSATALVSRRSDPEKQGEVLGVN